jgi:hypothetical protein
MEKMLCIYACWCSLTLCPLLPWCLAELQPSPTTLSRYFRIILGSMLLTGDLLVEGEVLSSEREKIIEVDVRTSELYQSDVLYIHLN